MSDLLIFFIVIFCFILILLILYMIMVSKICDSKSSLEYYKYNSINYKPEEKQPVILMLGSIHGNEPSGYYALRKLMEDLNTNQKSLKNGQLIIIPVVNYCAFQLGIRFIPFIGDMNRKFPDNLDHTPSNQLISQIVELIKQADFILDFHEGWGFNRQNSNSMGSTLTPTNNELCNNLAVKIVNDLDKKIDKDYMKYRIYTDNEELLKSNSDLYQNQHKIKGALSYYCQLLGKNYILVETSGQNNIMNLDTRVDQNNTIINDVLSNYNMI
jgi:hypothetical protein